MPKSADSKKMERVNLSELVLINKNLKVLIVQVMDFHYYNPYTLENDELHFVVKCAKLRVMLSEIQEELFAFYYHHGVSMKIDETILISVPDIPFVGRIQKFGSRIFRVMG
jgi:hypothetical protein